MTSRVRLLVLVALLWGLSSGYCHAAKPAGDWPSFRGADRTGISHETGLLKQWPVDGPKLLWETAGAGRGYSSLAIAGGKFFVLGDSPSTADDKDEYLLGYDLESHKQIFKTKVGPAWSQGNLTWQGSRSTPTIDGQQVYVLTAHGELLCCSTDNGEIRWRKNLKQDFGGKKGDSWGYSESVLIDGDRLICTPGGDKATMVALNKDTGELIWKSVREGDRGAGHSSIVISEPGGTRNYVQTTASGAMGVRADDGKLLWKYDIDQTTAVVPVPILRGDLVFFSAGYRRGGALLKQIPGANHEVGIEEIYPLNTDLSNRHGGIVLIGDYIYGDSDNKGIPFCADFMTGKVKWKKRGSGHDNASIIAAEDLLYIRYADGTMVLAKASPDDHTEISSFKPPASGAMPSWSHPVILDGKLYLREQDRIFCYDIKAR